MLHSFTQAFSYETLQDMVMICGLSLETRTRCLLSSQRPKDYESNPAGESKLLPTRVFIGREKKDQTGNRTYF
jgi:hypothetical protein